MSKQEAPRSDPGLSGHVADAPGLQGASTSSEAGLPSTPHSALGRQLTPWLVLITAAPLLILGSIVVAIFTSARNELGRAQLVEAASSIAARIDADVDMHRRAIQMAAAEPGRATPAELQARLGRYHASYPGFLTMLATDSAGFVIVRQPDRARDGRPFPAAPTSVADRPYFRVPRATMRPFISGVFRGRGFGSDVIVALSAPIRTEGGGFGGVVEGSLDLSRQRRFAEHALRIPGITVLAIDPAGQVVFSVNTGANPAMSPAPGWVRGIPPSSARSGPLAGKRHLVARAVNGNGWSVVVARPFWQFHAPALWSLFLGVIGVLVALTLSVLLSRRIADRATRPLLDSEARYRGLVENASDIIFRSDYAGRFTYVNPAAERTTARGGHQLVGTHYLELVKPEFRAAVSEFYRRQFAAQALLTYFEFPAVTGEGREVWLGQSLQLELQEGRVSGAQAIARDITARHEVERIKDEFVSLVSHELRTPLTSLRGSLGLLSSGRLGDALRVNQMDAGF